MNQLKEAEKKATQLVQEARKGKYVFIAHIFSVLIKFECVT